MNQIDDDHLIDVLRRDLASEMAEMQPPDGLTDGAKRMARRRQRTRMAGSGAAVLAAAGVATVLATGSGSGSTATSAPSAGGSGPLAPAATRPAKPEDTAYIVRRVRAKVAADNGHSTIQQQEYYFGGSVGSDGSLVDLGPRQEELYQYTAPDGTRYLHGTEYEVDGRPMLIFFSVIGPVINGEFTFSGTHIDPVNHTYSQGQTDYSVAAGGDAPGIPSPRLSSSPSEVQQALKSGQVTQMGTPTFNGAPAIALSITSRGGQDILYVDPQTYQPLGQAFGGQDVSYWVPSTPGNIAKATRDISIPAGYTKVYSAALNGNNAGSGNSGNSGSGNTGNS